MDAIYEGAEFAIMAAVSDARTGLPGDKTTPRKPQPRVVLKERSQATGAALVNNPAASTLDPCIRLLGVTTEEHEEAAKDGEWLYMHHHGFRHHTKLDLSDFLKDKEIMETYDISNEHLKVFQDFADDSEESIDEFMVKMTQIAQNIGIHLQELAPHMLKDIVNRCGMPGEIEKPLPLGRFAGKTVLISMLEDPRITVRNSEWAIRGWTYQEGVLSNRRLVFTEQQACWECRGMVLHESLDLRLDDLCDPSSTRMAD